MKDFISGLKYNLSGFRYFLSEKRLWVYAILPFLINLAALFLLVTLYINYFPDIFNLIGGPFQHLDANHAWARFFLVSMVLWAINKILMVMFFLLSILLILIFVFVISSLVSAPFYEMLAEKIMVLKGACGERHFSIKQVLSESMHTIRFEALRWFFYMLIFAVLFLLSLIPVVGVFFSLLQFFITAWFFALSYCVFPMVVERRSTREMFKWALKNKFRLAGFGILALVPFLNFFIAMIQVVGGTLMYLESREIAQ